MEIRTVVALRRRVGTPSHIYYLFSSTLLASCSEAMTERFSLLEELFYSVWSTTGDLCCSVLLISYLNCNSEICYAKLPEPLNVPM
ncbi:hypothetical protein [Tolypothrix sp. NIES-4075]|uniref:hypothetical protein n=1 Tax=Tolypothrix sp. NIES-4075 TaxID=2005459 RepID=UPI00117CD634|nr:hypothetical protein [Tolypothrix sp. NIES-4075]